MRIRTIIATVLSSKEAFQKLLPFIRYSTFDGITKIIWDEITSYYEIDPHANSVELQTFIAKITRKHPKEEVAIQEYLEGLPAPGSLPNILQVYEDVLKEDYSHIICGHLLNNAYAEAEKLMEEFLVLDIKEKEEEVFHATPLDELEKHFEGKNLIPLFPSAISDALGGGVPRQTQICIFARPDVGKSTAAINTIAGAAELGYKVLYLGNEDPAPKMVYRIVSRLIRKPEIEIKKDLHKNYEEAVRRGYNNIFFKPMHPGTLGDVRAAVERYEPDIVVIDQIRNMRIKPESMTINLEQGVIGMRNLAKEFNFVSIVITQAGASAQNKLGLEMEDVEWSNTGVAAQMDLMIGLGQNKEMKDQGRVFLSFPKNKFTAPIKPFSCEIEYAINRLRA